MGNRKYKLNEYYFEKIDSEDKAYFLGLMYADGYNCCNTKSRYFKISLQEEDGYILKTFQQYLGSNYPLVFHKKRKKSHSNYISLQINGYISSMILEERGCPQCKSSILTFPSKNIVPEYLQNHFIRGVFDGDGSIWNGKRKKMIIKDNSRKSVFRERIIHNVKFNITGSTDMIENIQNILVNKLKFKKNKLNHSKKLEHCIQMEYSGRQQLKQFYNYLYTNSTIFLIRKKQKFEDIFNCASMQ